MIDVLGAFPDGADLHLEVVHLVGVSQGALGLEGHELPLEVEVVELDVMLLFLLPPGDFGVVVGFSQGHVIGPFILFGLPLTDGFGLRVDAFVLVVGEAKSMVVEGALLLDAEGLGVGEVVDFHLGDVIEEELVVDGEELLLGEVVDVDLVLGYIEDDALLLVHHAEEVDDVWIFVFVEDVSIGGVVHQALLGAGLDDVDGDEGVVVGRGEAEDLPRLLLEFDGG